MSNVKQIGSNKKTFNCLIVDFDGSATQYNDLTDYSFDGMNLMLFPSDFDPEVPCAVINVAAHQSIDFQEAPFPEEDDGLPIQN